MKIVYVLVGTGYVLLGLLVGALGSWCWGQCPSELIALEYAVLSGGFFVGAASAFISAFKDTGLFRIFRFLMVLPPALVLLAFLLASFYPLINAFTESAFGFVLID